MKEDFYEEQITVNSTALNKTDDYWGVNRQEQLNKNEEGIYNIISLVRFFCCSSSRTKMGNRHQ